MKKMLLVAFVLFSNLAVAQIYVNQKNINSANYQYLEVWEKFNRASGKFYVMVDYGQDISNDPDGISLRMHDKKRNFLEFNSVVAILNYFYLNGWEVLQPKQTDDVVSYLLKRRTNFTIPNMNSQGSPSIGSN